MSAYFLSACRSSGPVQGSYTGSGKALLFLESKNGFSPARVLDLTTLAHQEVEVPIMNPHSAQKLTTSGDEFIVFDFMGSAVKANVRTGEIFKAPNATGVFMGHGTQTDEGATVWCTEVHREKGIVVRARRTSDLSLIEGPHKEFPGGHHVTKLPDSDLLATGWYDLKEQFPAVRFFNRKTGQSSIARLPDHITVSHLLPVSETEVVAITNVLINRDERKEGWNRNPLVQSTYESVAKATNAVNKKSGPLEFDPAHPAPLIYAHVDGTTNVFWPEKDAELFRYGFSIDTLPVTPKQFITCHTIGNTVVIWDMSRTVNHYIPVDSPRGAVSSPDGKLLYILSLGKLKVWSREKGAFIDEISFERPVANLSRYS